jgi:3D (Asp-Asp-Asp) domain-containing protein
VLNLTEYVLKILQLFTIMGLFALGAMAQAKPNDSVRDNIKTEPLVVKTASVKSTSSLSFVATAYSLRGRMANGQNVHVGAIAADPRVLPMGTVVIVEGLGTFVVKDTGGAIKGNRIDIWVSDQRKAIRFGRRTVVLKIISKPRKI